MYEFYILVKHGGFSYLDILHMPIFERRGFIDILLEENNKRREMAENSKPPAHT
jgi:hypothetical protein